MAIGNTAIGGAGQPLSTAFHLLSRLMPVHRKPAFHVDALEAQAPIPQQATVDQLTVTLLDMGLGADRVTLGIAETFARVGIAINPASVATARAALARAPGATPASFALASAMGLPQSTSVLRSLATVVYGLPAGDSVSAEARAVIALNVAPQNRPLTAARLRELIARVGRTTENRLLAHDAIIDDPRIALLAMAAREQDAPPGSDLLARHLEGQQILNAASRQAGLTAPLYYGFYLQLPGSRPAPVEVQIKREREAPESDAPSGSRRIVVTIRVTTERLGAIEAQLARQANGLAVELRSDREETVTRMHRRAPELADVLTASGWDLRKVSVSRTSEPTPLWFGGDALSRPRVRVNWKA